MQFYTSSNMAISGNSTVDLLVIAFSPNVGHCLLKLLRVDLVLVEKVRMAASCWLFTAFSARFLVRMFVDFGDVYIAVCIHYVQFSMLFFNSPSVFFILLPAKSEVSMHGEVLSSPWLATPTRYRVVSGSSTPDSSTPSSSTIFALQLLIASHKQFRWGSGGRAPQF